MDKLLGLLKKEIFLLVSQMSQFKFILDQSYLFQEDWTIQQLIESQLKHMFQYLGILELPWLHYLQLIIINK